MSDDAPQGLANRSPLCRIRDIYRMIADCETTLQQRCGIGLNEGMLLCALAQEGRCTSGQAAGLLHLSLSNASKVIQSAEKKGFVHRSLGQNDRRQMLFELTDAGQQCVDKVQCSHELAELLNRIRAIVA